MDAEVVGGGGGGDQLRRVVPRRQPLSGWALSPPHVPQGMGSQQVSCVGAFCFGHGPSSIPSWPLLDPCRHVHGEKIKICPQRTPWSPEDFGGTDSLVKNGWGPLGGG